MNYYRYISQGFTLIELLIVISIFIIIAVVSVPIYGNWQATTQIDEVTTEIIQALRLAKTRSQAGLNNSSQGVYFEVNESSGDAFTIYQGSSYVSRDINYDQETILGDTLILITTLAGNEINFSKGLGEPTATGTIMIVHGTTDEIATVTINRLGVIDVY
jgi:prepilin-type N-terminal cleavage/methylation domain-containing protein